MNIGIIGSGNIGGALTRLFRALGHDVAVANSRGPASLIDLCAETGARPVSVGDAARGSDVVVVAVPLKNVPDLPSGLFAAEPASLIVIDTCNYYPRHRDGRIDDIEAGMVESRWVERHLAHPVVKVFNSIMAQHLLERGKPTRAVDRIALAVAGDDAGAKATVMRLVDEIGFDTVDAGTIEDSWRQQPGSPGYLKDHDAAGVRSALGEARHDRTPEWRATPDSPGTFASPA